MGCNEERFLHTRQLLTDYVAVLANTGMRVGEANNLKIRDVMPFTDGAAIADTIKRILARRDDPQPDDWFFCMKNGTKIINLGDQFDKVLKLANVEKSAAGDKFCLYSLRHFYAVQAIRNGIGVFDIARNMGTSIEIIQAYYAKQATPMILAEKLGGKVTDKI
jgi:integrase